MKTPKLTKQTNQKSKDQVTEVRTYFGTILLILSGFILYLDKIFNFYNIGSSIEFGYYETLEAFVWHISQTISPLLIILAYQFKPKKWALLSPLSIYSIQVMYILRDEHFIEADYFYLYTIVFIVCSFFCFYFLDKLVNAYALSLNKLKKHVRKLNSYLWGKVKTKELNEIEVFDTIILDDE